MKKTVLITALIFCSVFCKAQAAATRLQEAFRVFEQDPQLKHALVSLYVIEAKTGKTVFDRNSMIGLAPASTQKIITSATAFELLGQDYRFKTSFSLLDNNGKTILCIQPSGDPTLGSWRWENTTEANVLSRLFQAAGKNRLDKVSAVWITQGGWPGEQIPDGWIWQDIGNYYGAGADAFNWRENQYDLVLRSGAAVGSPVEIVRTIPVLYTDNIVSEATAGAKGSGDNAYIYLPAGRKAVTVRGTIPAGEKAFKISGSLTDAGRQWAGYFFDSIGKKGGGSFERRDTIIGKQPVAFHTELSPPLDSIIYWFNKKSINLYGEALIRTFGYLGNHDGRTGTGVDILKDLWKARGLDAEELNIRDGSGLSPLNRVTTHAQVTILKYAKQRPWFAAFYDALPEYNGMKMKSGTISGAKGFCGYQTGKDGTEYVFSFLVNNYNGSAGALVNKMYTVLNTLK